MAQFNVNEFCIDDVLKKHKKSGKKKDDKKKKNKKDSKKTNHKPSETKEEKVVNGMIKQIEKEEEETDVTHKLIIRLEGLESL